MQVKYYDDCNTFVTECLQENNRAIHITITVKSRQKDHEIKTDPGSQNKSRVFKKKYGHLNRICYWPIFLKLCTNIFIWNTSDKFVGQTTPLIFNLFIGTTYLIFVRNTDIAIKKIPVNKVEVNKVYKHCCMTIYLLK